MAAALTMQSTGATLHPFFTRPCNAIEAETGQPAPGYKQDEHDTLEENGNVEGNTAIKKKGSTRGRKPKKGQDGKSQRTLAQVLNPTAPSEAPQHDQHVSAYEEPSACVSPEVFGPGGDGMNKVHAQPVDVTDATPGALPVAQQPPVEAPQDEPQRPPSPHVLIPASSPRTHDKREMPQEFDDAVPSTPPKKMMRLGRGGKLASPSTKSKKEEVTQEKSGGKRRGRLRKAKGQPPTSRVVVCKYGEKWSVENRTSYGQRIVEVLSGEERIELPQTTPKKQRTPKKPKKPTHPFFGGKPKEKSAPKPPSPRKAAAITPGKLRAQAMQDRPHMPSNDVQYPVGSALLKDRLMVKHPGAREPPWPAKEQMHVRGFDTAPMPDLSQNVRGRGKRKRLHRAPLPDRETSLLHNFASSLEAEQEPATRLDGYHAPRSDVRLPQKHLISGRQLAARIAPEVSASLPDPNPEADELSYPTASQSSAHPALLKMYSALPTYLSAFDHCKGEAQGWAHKYAPVSSKEVLQSSREMDVLRDWLQSLTVNAVGEMASIKPAAKVAPKPKKKKRRKDDDLNDFLVDSGDEGHDMDILTDPEDTAATGSKRSLQSIVQASNGHGKLSNAVLLSGPHGCGKTAAAYAVAKELGFQVFEISSAERRTGRDVLDRVGDMTENHIVKNHGIDPGELSASEDRSHMEAAFQKDLESGRQGKMNAFFKAKPTAAAPKMAQPKVKIAKVQTLQKLQKALKKPAREQQQSLVLLEEVDILFKEDKEFWTTVLKLIATSKRPFIMTCNDEDLVPLQAMSLHAILRFSPTPTDLAVDYMLLMAALEGHLLKRDAIASLYDAHQQDLRASISELDFWCQMGVGDPRGGLDWIYQRYPPGSDVNGHGHTLRVVSEDTYQQGMGMVRPDLQVDEDAVLSAWQSFDVSPTTLLGWDHGLRGTTADLEIMGPGMTGTNPSTLKDIAKLADSLSASDVYTTHSITDPALPEITGKARLQYIEGLSLLESNGRVDYIGLSAQLSVASTLSAYRAFGPLEAVQHALSPRNLLSHIQSSSNHPTDDTLGRHSFSCFDPLAAPSTSALSTSPGLEISAFDGPLQPIVTDIAPYVRSIVHYDALLAEQRAMLGGHERSSKKARTTRAARSALEGSQRSDTRREKWFGKELDAEAVLATGGSGWPRVVEREEREGSEGAPGSSMESAGSVEVG